MRLQPLAIALLALTMLASAAPLHAQTTPNNLLVVDPNAPPPADLLDAAERERIARLQDDAVFTLPISPVSPDDRAVFVTSGEQIGFLDIADGSSTALDPQRLEPYVPLPLAGFSRFTWLGPTTLGALAIDLTAPTQEAAFVRLRIDRESLAVDAAPLRLPPRSGILSVAPDLRRLLLVQLPPGEGEDGQTAAPTRVRLTRPVPGLDRMTTPAVPPALRRQIAAARRLQPAAFARLWAAQPGADGTVSAAPRTVDLLLMTDGEPAPRYLTTVPEASVLFGEVWSRDSSRLAFSLYGLADPDAARPVFDGALLSEEIYRDATGNMPPSINPILQNNNTYVVDSQSGAVQILRPGGEAAPPILSAHAWSPDNRTLLVQAWHPARLKGRTYPIYSPQFSERTSLRFYESGSAGLREVGRFESNLFSAGAFARTVAEFLSPDELLFRADAGTDRHPYYYNRVSGELRNLADRAGSYYNLYSTNRSRRLVFTYTSFTDPPDVFSMGWDGRNLARLTWFGEELRIFAGLRQDPVRFTLPGGQTRVGVLVQPAAAPFPPRDARVIVWQEGGPGPAMFNSWAAIVERPFALLPGMGIALLVTPLAGRPGYDTASFNRLADGTNFGQVDIDEQAAIIRELIKRGWTSQGKVGISGCSYGGYFAAQSIVRHPELYAAANLQCAWIDTTTEWTRGYDSLMPYLIGLPPYNLPEEYRRDSPAYNVDKIKAAVLTFHGSEDFLPIVQNENLHLQLVNRGLPARMVKFIGEGHGLTNPDNQHYAAEEQISWFRTHLK